MSCPPIPAIKPAASRSTIRYTVLSAGLAERHKDKLFYQKDNNSLLKFRKMFKFASIITETMGHNDIIEQQTTTEGQFIDGIKELLEAARNNVVKQVNTTMLMTYFEIGRRIVEQEQKGESQADYGQYLLVRLSESLSGRFGKGFSKRNLELMDSSI